MFYSCDKTPQTRPATDRAPRSNTSLIELVVTCNKGGCMAAQEIRCGCLTHHNLRAQKKEEQPCRRLSLRRRDDSLAMLVERRGAHSASRCSTVCRSESRW